MSNECFYAFGAINYKNGFVTSCPQQSDQLYIMKDTTRIKPSEILNSEGFKQHRKDLLDGKWPVGCKLCERVEVEGAGKSMRQDYPAPIEHLNKETGEINFVGLNHIELRFSNSCNFACLHCSEVYSSQWQQKIKNYVPDQEDFDHGIIQLTKRMHRVSNNDNLSMSLSIEEMETIVNDLNENFPNLEKVDFAGGEVLYQKQFFPCLELLGKHPNAANIKICFHSNFNTKFDPVRLFELLSVFNKVNIMISVDAGKRIYPYFRGGDWDVLTNNLTKFKALQPKKKRKIELCLVCTTSAYQLMDIEDIFESFVALEVDWINSSIAYTPSYLNPAVMMHEFKDEILTSISAARRIIIKEKLRREATGDVESFYSWREKYNEFADLRSADEALTNIENYILNTKTKTSDYEAFLVYIKKSDKIWKQNFNDFFTNYGYVENKIVKLWSNNVIDFSDSNKLYDGLDPSLGINLYRFDGLDMPFNPDWKNIGINLSGGADSSCLLMLLSKIIVQTGSKCRVHVIQHHRCWNIRPWQGPVALAVFNKFQELFPTIEYIRYKNFIPVELEWGVLGPITKDQYGRERSGDQIIVAAFNEYTMYQENLNAMYNGTSKNPDVAFPGGMENREKEAKDSVLKEMMFSKVKGHVILPFKFVDKSWIVAQFYRQDMEELYNTTRSCEGSLGHNTTIDLIPTLDDYKPGMYVPICKECFWCLERDWADSKLKETLQQIEHATNEK